VAAGRDEVDPAAGRDEVDPAAGIDVIDPAAGRDEVGKPGVRVVVSSSPVARSVFFSVIFFIVSC